MSINPFEAETEPIEQVQVIFELLANGLFVISTPYLSNTLYET
ncbi:hypothetical protein [Clostridium estertheticum]|nr:hypothetical protein [Clostridium estertheticum]